MRRPVFANFVIGLRAPWRSRLVAALVALLAVAVLALPAHLHSDGTAAGELRMLLTWTLGPAMALLGAATLWAGCASLSPEVWDRRFASAAVTPARSFDVWLGRWLGLVALDAVLLAAVLFGIGVQSALRVPAPARAVRARLEADPAAFEEQVRRIYRGVFPDGAPAEKEAGILESIRRDLGSDSYLPVAPGQGRGWRFLLPDRLDGPAEIRFQFMSSYGSLQGVAGRIVATVGGGRTVAEIPVTNDDTGFVSAQIPAESLAGERMLSVEFQNLEAAGGASVLLRQADSLRVLVPHGRLAANLARAFLPLLAALALLAALGTAFGCAFSFPVAAFLATAACAITLASGGEGFREDAADIGHRHGAPVVKTAFDLALADFSAKTSAALRATIEPVRRAEALDRLGDGIAVSTPVGLRALLLDGLALPLLFGLFGALTLRGHRRNLP